MNDGSMERVHWSFWAISVIALIWNAMGVMNLIWQLTMNADALAAIPEAKRAVIEGRPTWATGAFATAVLGGALGCILLLLKKRVAYYLFVISLLAMLAQAIPYLSIAITSFGAFEILMFIIMPIAVAAFLIWYAKHAEHMGWIG